MNAERRSSNEGLVKPDHSGVKPVMAEAIGGAHLCCAVTVSTHPMNPPVSEPTSAPIGVEMVKANPRCEKERVVTTRLATIRVATVTPVAAPMRTDSAPLVRCPFDRETPTRLV